MVPDFIPPFGISALSAQEDAGLPPAGEPPVVLADDIDPETGELLSLDGVHPVDAHVRYQFQVRAASGAAVGRVGHRFRDIQVLDDRAPNALRHEATRIFKMLSPWVRLEPPNADVSAVRVETDPTTQLGAVVVDYFNVIAQESNELRRPLEG